MSGSPSSTAIEAISQHDAFVAAFEGNLEIVSRYLDNAGVHVDDRYEFYERSSATESHPEYFDTLLYVAVIQEHHDLIRLLIEEHGASMNGFYDVQGYYSLDNDKATLLGEAIQTCSESTCNLLIDLGAPINFVTDGYDPAITFACSHKKINVMKKILELSPDAINDQSDGFGSAVNIAAYQNDFETVKLLVQGYGASVFDVDNEGVKSPVVFVYAAFHGNYEMMRFALSCQEHTDFGRCLLPNDRDYSLFQIIIMYVQYKEKRKEIISKLCEMIGPEHVFDGCYRWNEDLFRIAFSFPELRVPFSYLETRFSDAVIEKLEAAKPDKLVANCSVVECLKTIKTEHKTMNRLALLQLYAKAWDIHNGKRAPRDPVNQLEMLLRVISLRRVCRPKNGEVVEPFGQAVVNFLGAYRDEEELKLSPSKIEKYTDLDLLQAFDAVQEGCIDAVRTYLANPEHDVNVRYQYYDDDVGDERLGHTLVYVAVMRQHHDLIAMLVESGASLDGLYSKREGCCYPEEASQVSILAEAVLSCDESTCLLLLTLGASLSFSFDSYDCSVMSMACAVGKLEVVKKILELNPAELTGVNYEESDSPIAAAANANQFDVVRYLADTGACVVEVRTDEANYPVVFACGVAHQNFDMMAFALGRAEHQDFSNCWVPSMRSICSLFEVIVNNILDEGEAKTMISTLVDMIGQKHIFDGCHGWSYELFKRAFSYPELSNNTLLRQIQDSYPVDHPFPSELHTVSSHISQLRITHQRISRLMLLQVFERALQDHEGEQERKRPVTQLEGVLQVVSQRGVCRVPGDSFARDVVLFLGVPSGSERIYTSALPDEEWSG